MSPLPGRPLISAARIRARVRELAADITAHYDGRPFTVVGLMNGSLFFLVDLLRRLPPQVQWECWRVSSYRGRTSTGRIRGLDACPGSYHGRQVLLVDDILDTGRTLAAVRHRLLQQGARTVRLCVLLDKNVPRAEPLRPHWTGFQIADEFVIGYGLDLDHQYRSLPMIRALPSPGKAASPRPARGRSCERSG